MAEPPATALFTEILESHFSQSQRVTPAVLEAILDASTPPVVISTATPPGNEKAEFEAVLAGPYVKVNRSVQGTVTTYSVTSSAVPSYTYSLSYNSVLPEAKWEYSARTRLTPAQLAAARASISDPDQLAQFDAATGYNADTEALDLLSDMIEIAQTTSGYTTSYGWEVSGAGVSYSLNIDSRVPDGIIAGVYKTVATFSRQIRVAKAVIQAMIDPKTGLIKDPAQVPVTLPAENEKTVYTWSMSGRTVADGGRGTTDSFSWASAGGEVSHSISLDKHFKKADGTGEMTVANYSTSTRVTRADVQAMISKVQDPKEKAQLESLLTGAIPPLTTNFTYTQSGSSKSYGWSSADGNDSYRISVDDKVPSGTEGGWTTATTFNLQQRVSLETLIAQLSLTFADPDEKNELLNSLYVDKDAQPRVLRPEMAYASFSKTIAGGATSYSWSSWDGNTSHTLSLEQDPNAAAGTNRVSYSMSERVARSVVGAQGLTIRDAGALALFKEEFEATEAQQDYLSFYKQTAGAKISYTWSAPDGNATHTVTADSASADPRPSYTKQERVSREQMIKDLIDQGAVTGTLTKTDDTYVATGEAKTLYDAILSNVQTAFAAIGLAVDWLAATFYKAVSGDASDIANVSYSWSLAGVSALGLAVSHTLMMAVNGGYTWNVQETVSRTDASVQDGRFRRGLGGRAVSGET